MGKLKEQFRQIVALEASILKAMEDRGYSIFASPPVSPLDPPEEIPVPEIVDDVQEADLLVDHERSIELKKEWVDNVKDLLEQAFPEIEGQLGTFAGSMGEVDSTYITFKSMDETGERVGALMHEGELSKEQAALAKDGVTTPFVRLLEELDKHCYTPQPFAETCELLIGFERLESADRALDAVEAIVAEHELAVPDMNIPKQWTKSLGSRTGMVRSLED